MITSKEFYIMQGMVDRYDRIRPYSIFDLFQEISVHCFKNSIPTNLFQE